MIHRAEFSLKSRLSLSGSVLPGHCFAERQRWRSNAAGGSIEAYVFIFACALPALLFGPVMQKF